MEEIVNIKCGTLIDGNSRKTQKNVILQIQGKKIVKIFSSDELKEMEKDQLIDATAYTVMPGMMDIHVHLASVIDPHESHPYMAMITTPPCLQTIHAAKNAYLMLKAGFTTVRDLAGFANAWNQEVIAVRKGIEIGLIPGPRIFAGGWVGPTAGHLHSGTPINLQWERPFTADGPWKCRELVRNLVRQGADLIKTEASGGAAGFGEEIWWRSNTLEELQAIVDQSHAFRRKVASHCHTAESVKISLQAGVDTIEHGSELDDEAIAMFQDTGAYLIPTLTLRSARGLEGRRKAQGGEHYVEKGRRIMEEAKSVFKKALEGKVKIAVGTDTYMSLRDYWGKNAYELEIMVEYGMSAMEAIIAATKTSAEALGAQDFIGTIQEGKFADILVIDGNPLDDIRILQDHDKILLVIKEGEIVVNRCPSLYKGEVRDYFHQ